MREEFRQYLDSLPLRRLPYWPQGNPPPLKVREKAPARRSREKPAPAARPKPQLRLPL